MGLGLTSSSAKQVETTVVDQACSTTYEVYYNGSFVGYHTEYNYSLSCSGQDSGVILITERPILA